MIYHGKKYHGITIYHDILFFSQPETNYTIEGIIACSGYIYCYTLDEVHNYSDFFKQPFAIKPM